MIFWEISMIFEKILILENFGTFSKSIKASVEVSTIVYQSSTIVHGHIIWEGLLDEMPMKKVDKKEMIAHRVILSCIYLTNMMEGG